MLRIVFTALAVCLLAAFSVAPHALAQQKPAVSDALRPMLEQAQKDGMTVVIMSPPQASAPTAAKGMSGSMDDIAGMGMTLRGELRRLFDTAPQIPYRIRRGDAHRQPGRHL